MNTLDKVYNLTIDIKNIDVKYNSYAKFFDDDRETSVIRIKLLNDKTPMNLENCIVEAYFILADNTYHNEACKIINSSEGVVELQLCQKCLVKGENIVRLSILKDNEISNTPVITYEVRKGLYSDNPSFNDDPLTPILSQMLLDIKVTKVNQIELQERYEKSLPKIEGKIKEVESLINRVDTVIASGTQDLEVIDARDGEVSLKARLDRDLYKDGISLSDRIEAIEGLKDSQNMKYETDKGYLVCKETKNGVIDDLKIEGKTLVNLLKQNGTWALAADTTCYCNYNLVKPLEVGKTYTYFYFNLPNTITQSYLGTASGDIILVFWGAIQKAHSFIATEERATLTHVVPHFKTNGTDTLTTSEIENIKVVLLEGDHTQNPPSYFEGLMSVGGDVDKIEVLSRKEDGNLFDFNSQGNHYETTPFIEGDTIRIEGKWYADFKLLVKPNTNYTISYTNFSGNRNLAAIYKPNENTVTNVTTNGKGIFNSGNNTKVNVYIYSGNGTLGTSYYTNFKIEEGSQVTEYVNCKVNKKQILFYNENGELEPVTELHEWDSIEKHSDNKWYYHKRSGKVVLNGSENWILHTTNYFKLSNPDMKVFDNTIKPNMISDRYITMSLNNSNTVDNSISNGNGVAYIYIYIIKQYLP